MQDRRPRRAGQGRRLGIARTAAAALILAAAAASQSETAETLAERLCWLTLPGANPVALFYEFPAAANSGRLSELSEWNFVGVLDAVETAAQRDGKPASLAHLRYYTAWAWRMRGRLDKAREVLEATEAAIPDTEYGRQQRRELLVTVQRALGDLDAANATWGLAQGSCAGDPSALADLWRLKVRLSIEGGRLDRAAHALGLLTKYTHAIPEPSKDLDEDEREAARRARVVAHCHVRSSRWHVSLAAGAHNDVLEDAEKCLGETTEVANVLRHEAKVFRAVAAAALEFNVFGSDRGAVQKIEEALRMPQLDPSHLRLLNLKKLELAVHSRDADAAAEVVSQWGSHLAWREGSSVGNEFLLFEALRVQTQLMGETDRATLLAARDRLQRMFDRLCEDWRAAKLAESGSGFLMLSTRRMFLAAYVEVELQLASRPTGEPDTVGNATERAFQILLDAQQFGTTARALGASRVEVAALIGDEGWIQPGCGILAFLPSKRVTYVFLVDREHGVRCERIASRPELMVQVRPFLRELSVHPNSAVKNAALGKRMFKRGQRVASLLWNESICAALDGWRGVTVVGMDAMNRLPISAVPLDDERLFGEALAVDLVDGIPLAVQLRSRREDAAASRESTPESLKLHLLGVTKPDLGDAADVRGPKIEAVDFPRESALERILGTYPDNAVAWIDEAATRQKFLSADLSGVDIVHVLAHGVQSRDPEREIPHGIALADGALWHTDLASLRLSGLFVLSACSSGTGAERVGDGLLAANLGGALLRAGAHTVIQSSVPIELRAHLELMLEFHAAIRAGDSPAAALQQARLARRDLDGLAMRFFRGQVEVYGDGQSPLQ